MIDAVVIAEGQVRVSLAYIRIRHPESLRRSPLQCQLEDAYEDLHTFAASQLRPAHTTNTP